MPKLNSRGDVAHGIGGGRVNLNNAVVYPIGGVGGWLDDETIGFVGGEQWFVSKFHVPTSRAETIQFGGRAVSVPPEVQRPYSRSYARSQERVANNLRAGGGHVTAWGPGGMFSTRDGLTLPDAGLIDMGYDGALIYKPLYHSFGPTLVREIDGSEWQITAGHTDYVHHVGQRRAVHLEGGRVFAHNLPQPQYVNADGIWKTEIAFAGGEWWISYYSAAHGIVLHPFNSLVGFSVLAKGDGWHTIRELDERTIRVAISVGEGEQAGDIWVRDYDVIANRIRDPWGANVWARVSRVEIPKINQQPDEPKEPHMENGWFPRLSVGGQVVSGFGTVTFRGKKILDPGYKPKWLDDGKRIVAGGLHDFLYEVNVETGETKTLHGSPISIYAAGAGKWHVAQRDAGEIQAEFDPVTGDLITVVEHGNRNDARSIHRNGDLISDVGPLLDARSFGGFVVWRNYARKNGTIQGFLDGQQRDLNTLADDWEGNPIPIRTDQGWWFSFMTNVDIRIRPIDSTQGYIIETGEDMNFNHDAVGLGSKIRVTWQDKNGNRTSKDLNLSDARTDVTRPLAKKPDEPKEPEPEEPKMNYREYGEYFARRWNELGIPAKTEEVARRVRPSKAERQYLKRIAEFRRIGRAAVAPTVRTNALEEAFKQVQCPALVQIVAELHHTEGNRDVGLSTKNGGNRWTLPDGRNCATDIVTVKPTNDAGKVVAGNFVLVDAIVSVGSPDARPAWMVLGPNEDNSRPWMQPPTPEGGNVEPEPGPTHRYEGGGNDTGVCDKCGRSRFDAIHLIPQSQIKHDYDGGEQDTGLCDICQKGAADPIHASKEEPDDPGEEPDLEKHDFVGGPNAKFCAECGQARTAPIHQKDEPAPGSGDMKETNAILRQMLAEQKTTNTKLDELRTGVIDAVRDFGKQLPGLLGGLGGILGKKK